MIGDILSELRKDHNMTQRELAEMLNTSAATVSHYETEKNAPDIATLVKLADYFGVSADYLLGRTRLRMDISVFARELRLMDGNMISAEQILTRFMLLSNKSQMETVDLIEFFGQRDKTSHDGLFASPQK